MSSRARFLNRAAHFAIPLLLVTACARGAPEAANVPPIAFVGANVISMTGAPPKANQTVIVVGDTIVAVGDVDTIEIPAGAQRIDGAGLFLMPGLADMHVHIDHPSELELYPAYGVTTVLNMRGLPSHLTWRGEIARRERFGPSLYTAGDYLDGQPPLMRPLMSLATPGDAAAAVRDQHRAGYDFIKVYTRLTLPQLEAIGTAAREARMAVVGHGSGNYTLDQLVAAGQVALAHGEEATRWYLDAEPDDDAIAALAETLRAADVTVIPNLNFARSMIRQKTDLDALLAQREARYLHPAILQPFRRANNRYARRDDAWLERVRRLVPLLRRVTAALASSGVPLLVGTDASTAGVYPGFSVYEELEELVAAGLDSGAALAAATVEPGRFISRHVDAAIRFGQIAPGYRADLLLLDGDPLADVRNVREQVGVMLRGRWHPRAALRAGLERLAVSHSDLQPEVVALEQHIVRGEIEQARALFDRVRAERPGAILFSQYVPFFVGYGFLYDDDGFSDDPEQLEVALGLYTMYAETYPQFHSAHLMLAEARRASDDLAGAQEALARALEIHPYHPEARALRAEIDAALGKTEPTPATTGG